MQAPDEKFQICKTCGQAIAIAEPAVVCNPIVEAQDTKQSTDSSETTKAASPATKKRTAKK